MAAGADEAIPGKVADAVQLATIGAFDNSAVFASAR